MELNVAIFEFLPPLTRERIFLGNTTKFHPICGVFLASSNKKIQLPVLYDVTDKLFSWLSVLQFQESSSVSDRWIITHCSDVLVHEMNKMDRLDGP